MSSKESSKQWHGGKGSKPRGGNTMKEQEVYRSNWDRIFGGIDYSSLAMLDKDVAKDKVDKDKEKVDGKDNG